jgi:hypothetical protein
MLPIHLVVLLKQNRVADTFTIRYITRTGVSYQAAGNGNNWRGDRDSDEFSPTHLHILSEGKNEARLQVKFEIPISKL